MSLAIAHVRLGIVGWTVYLDGEPWTIKAFLELHDNIMIDREKGRYYEWTIVKASKLVSAEEVVNPIWRS